MRSCLITGAGGYIGSMLVKDIRDRGIQITALVRDKSKAERMFPANVRLLDADLSDERCVEYIRRAVGGIVPESVIHCASVTKSGEIISRPVETIQSIVDATRNVLELAKGWHIQSMVYLSSMEVYGNMDCSDGRRASEEESGFVNPLDARSCYPMGKRMAENLCYSYYREYGVPVKIARLAQIFGRGVPPSDTRVFAQFARAALEGRDIVLHTAGTSMGNYCGIDDAVRGILAILNSGADGEAYNVVNEANTMAIREMAQLVADEIAGGMIRVVYDIPKDNRYGYAPQTGLRLSGKKLEGLGWEPEQTLPDMYRDMLEGMRRQK